MVQYFMFKNQHVASVDVIDCCLDLVIFFISETSQSTDG